MLKTIFIPCQENNYRPKFLESEFLFYYLIIVILLRLVLIPFLFYFPQTLFFAEISRTSLIELTNQERKNSAINPLEENPQLNKAALLKAQDMIDKDYFSHQGPTGTTPWYWFQKAGYDYQIAGENLGIGFLDSEEIYQAWDNSPSHKANLLNSNFQDIGIAVLKGDFEGNETTLVVQLFGSPLRRETSEEKAEEKAPASVLSGIEGEEETMPESNQETMESQPQTEVKQEVRGSFGFNFLRFMAMDFSNLVQKIIFFSLILIVISLIINVFVKFDVQHKDLILKAVFFALILTLFIFINKDLIIKIIPHSLNIY